MLSSWAGQFAVTEQTRHCPFTGCPGRRIFKVDFRLMEAHMSENSGEIFISVECRLFVIQHVCVQL